MKAEPSKLGADRFERAASFLRTEARPLERMRFEYVFTSADRAGVSTELRKFQNPDGGFGHALEPDLRTSDSSALCSSIAFQVICECGISPDEDWVRRAIQYLVESLDQDKLHWRIIPRSAEEAPHAPWWNQQGREAGMDGFSLNPTAELVGYLLDFGGSELDSLLVEKILQRVNETVRSSSSLEMHDVLCCLRLLEAKALSPGMRSSLQSELMRHVSGAVETDPDKWGGYGLRPLQVAPAPQSVFLTGLEEAVAKNLDYEVSSQQADGAWHPTWSWGTQFEDTWEVAKGEWTGVLTFETLKALTLYDRINPD